MRGSSNRLDFDAAGAWDQLRDAAKEPMTSPSESKAITHAVARARGSMANALQKLKGGMRTIGDMQGCDGRACDGRGCDGRTSDFNGIRFMMRVLFITIERATTR
jgi:hypothetical protein